MNFLKLLLGGTVGFLVPLEVSGRKYLKAWVKHWGSTDPSTIPEAAWVELVDGCLKTARTLHGAFGKEGLRTYFLEQLKGEGSIIVALMVGNKEVEGSHTHQILLKHGVL